MTHKIVLPLLFTHISILNWWKVDLEEFAIDHLIKLALSKFFRSTLLTDRRCLEIKIFKNISLMWSIESYEFLFFFSLIKERINVNEKNKQTRTCYFSCPRMFLRFVRILTSSGKHAVSVYNGRSRLSCVVHSLCDVPCQQNCVQTQHILLKNALRERERETILWIFIIVIIDLKKMIENFNLPWPKKKWNQATTSLEPLRVVYTIDVY